MHQILDRFDETWNGPTPPRIEDFLPPADSPAYPPMLAELLKIDFERRCQKGELPALEEYRQRFPACSADVLEEMREAAQRLSSPGKETDDPGFPATLDGPLSPPPLGRPTRRVGEYELLERLGSGGMGEVYKARHRRLNKLVALKLLSADPRHPGEAIARFQREMKAVGSLDHPNVVEAHDAGEQSGVVYLAMKLIDGVDLERLVQQRGPLPIAQACEIVRQAALGLDYLHEHGLVHRDVKPSNLMRTPEGTIKVLDLGLARWCLEREVGHRLTGTAHVMGTPEFLAPEQIEHASLADARADLYGLGGTLFYLLTGRTPFADYKSLFAKLDAHRSQPPPDVRTLRPEVPAELAALLERLLAKNPAERLASAAEVAAVLAPFAGNSATTVLSPIPALPTTSRQATPPKLRWLWFVAALGLILAAIVLLWTQMRHPDEPPLPLHVVTLDVELTRNINGEGLPAGLVGKDGFGPHLGDTVTLDARLTRPAYAFLIAFRPDGRVELCFPENDDEPPPLTDNTRYPSTAASANEEYGFAEGVGLHAFAVVVSGEPLPAFDQWWPEQNGCPWKEANAPLGVVYLADGEGKVKVESWGVAGIPRGKGKVKVESWSVTGIPRGKGVKTAGKAPTGDLAFWLRRQAGIETVQVLAFSVAPAEKR
jgi:serine/threonine protein kinase